MTAPSDTDIHRAGLEIARAMRGGGFDPRHPLKLVDDRAMDFASSDQELKAALFRFVDVVPACRGLDDLARHLSAFAKEIEEPPASLQAAMRMADSRAGRRALGLAAATGVRHMAHRFIVGESPREALPVLAGLWRSGVASTVDLLGEATVTSAEADRYAERCATALDTLATAARDWRPDRLLEEDAQGPIARANLSIKISALTPLLRPEAPRRGLEDALPRVRALLRQAAELGAHLHIDMESFDSREAIADLVLEVLAEDEFRAAPSAGIVLQAYLTDSPDLAARLVDWSRATGRDTPLLVRLVKGAYWDHEVTDARQHGWEPPVFQEKAESDRNFEQLTRALLAAQHDQAGIRLAVASHNLRSVAHAVAVNRGLGGNDSDLELQVLRGLGDELQAALAKTGHRVRTYCPVGDLVAGMAYLVRRLLENTSNESFLQEQASGRPLDELLAAP